MNEQDRMFIFVTEAKIGTGNTLMKNIDRNPAQDTGNLTFGSVRLSSDGQEPMTHSGCSTAADILYRSALQGTSHAPWMDIYLKSDGFTWETSCADMGLQLIEEEDI